MDIHFSKRLRAGDVAGTQVRNPEGEDIGEIEDVVIDLDSGNIAYAVLCFHTWFNDKLFAIPWNELSLQHDSEGERIRPRHDTCAQIKVGSRLRSRRLAGCRLRRVAREEIDSHYRSDSSRAESEQR